MVRRLPYCEVRIKRSRLLDQQRSSYEGTFTMTLTATFGDVALQEGIFTVAAFITVVALITVAAFITVVALITAVDLIQVVALIPVGPSSRRRISRWWRGLPRWRLLRWRWRARRPTLVLEWSRRGAKGAPPFLHSTLPNPHATLPTFESFAAKRRKPIFDIAR